MGVQSRPDELGGSPLRRLDTSVMHPARRYNYWLGGKDNFAADRESAEQIASVYPAVRTAARENRAFLRRAVRFLVEEAGVRQFLDVGTGIPSADNTHEVAQALAPEARIVYVDNDPMVLVHARALLTSSSAGATAYLDADLRDPTGILEHPDLREMLDLDRPVALMLIAVVHFMSDEDRPYDLVARLLDALPSGSYLAMTHFTADLLPREVVERSAAAVAAGHYKPDGTARSRAEVGRFDAGLDLVEPGIVPVAEWRPEVPAEQRPARADASIYGLVARKP
ncbi:SAM-dependent methyltransferase [Micromonospora zhanjiangensis]